MALQKGMVSSNTNEWATPQLFFDKLNEEFNFTLDPCSTHQNHKCSKYFTLEEDGLSKDWSNEIVFMNPPYGGQAGEWVKKAYLESLKGAIVVCLIVAAPDRGYWHDFIFPRAAEIRFLRGRLKFGDSSKTAPFGSAVIVFDESKQFEEFRLYYSRVKFDSRS